jgi:hypothetical protein
LQSNNNMDPNETIAYLARQEARGYRFATSVEALDAAREEDDAPPKRRPLPYLDVTRDPVTGAYKATGHRHVGHANEARMPFLEAYLTQRVLPYVERGVDARGVYAVELHDSYSYLAAEAGRYRDCLVFSKHRDHRHVVLMPDIFQMSKYGGVLGLKDAVPWEAKRDTVAFFGTTTGDTDPRRNVRVQACRWGLDHRDAGACDFYLTHVAQMTPAALAAGLGGGDGGGETLARLLHPRVPEAHHHRYKFLLNLPGNTCAWNRLPMILNARSLCFHYTPCMDMCWYYPLLHAGTHYVPCADFDAVLTQRRYWLANPREAGALADRANAFVQQFLAGHQDVLYMVHLWEAMAEGRP